VVTKTFAFFAVWANGNQLWFKNLHISGNEAVKSCIFWFIFGLFACCLHIYRVVQKKLHKVNDTIILQPYVIESCGFQQNVPKEILYTTKVSI